MSDHRFLTAALPYANGPLHFGHLAGVYIPADIFHRHSKLSGKNSVYICGSDEHGVAITLSAEKAGVTYKEWVDRWNAEHQRLFKDYDIEFDYFGRTTSKLHEKNSQDFFTKIKNSGYLKEKTETQAYCLNDKMFLPDRYLSGECAKCGYPEARGDECPNCGSWLRFEEIKKPKCAKCGKSEIEARQVSQWYFDLPKLAPKIRDWLNSQKHWKENVRNYAISLLEGIPERAITRNVKWGIDLPAPLTDPDKKIYVWFEAPIGYFTNLQEYFDVVLGKKDGWKEFWDAKTPMIHFIGKDNIIFHTIIWPAMLMAAGERLPTNVPANMFVQLMKKQFSKSAGWYVDADEAVKSYGIDRVRYYLISIIPESQDTNFDWMVFKEKVNAELVNKIANLFNRVGTQILKHYGGRLEPKVFSGIQNLKSAHSEAAQFLEKFEMNSALNRIVLLTEEANKVLDDEKPWNLVKEDKEKAKIVFAKAANYMISIAALLQPFVPSYAARLFKAFSIPLTDQTLRSRLYQESGFEMLKGRGLQIDSAADFVIPRIEQVQIDEEVAKLGKLKKGA